MKNYFLLVISDLKNHKRGCNKKNAHIRFIFRIEKIRMYILTITMTSYSFIRNNIDTLCDLNSYFYMLNMHTSFTNVLQMESKRITVISLNPNVTFCNIFVICLEN